MARVVYSGQVVLANRDVILSEATWSLTAGAENPLVWLLSFGMLVLRGSLYIFSALEWMRPGHLTGSEPFISHLILQTQWVSCLLKQVSGNQHLCLRKDLVSTARCKSSAPGSLCNQN